MPIKKTKKGYKYGEKGKEYPTREQAIRQMKAIKANQKGKVK